MDFAAALILAASAPSQALPAPVPAASGGVRVMATASATIISSARIRPDDAADGPNARNGKELWIHRQRRVHGRRVLVEFD